MHSISQISIRIVAVLFAGAIATTAFAGTVDKRFTYQGVLRVDGSMPAFVFATFDLYRTETGGTSIAREFGGGGGIVFLGDNGEFFTELDFGETGDDGLPIFNGGDLFLEIIISNEVLTPRQRITPTPIASSMPGVFPFGNQLHLGEAMDNVLVGNGSQNTNFTISNGNFTHNNGNITLNNGNIALINGVVSATSSASSVASFSSTSTVGAWIRLINTSAGGSPWAIISTGSLNGEGPGALVIADQSAGGGPRMVINSNGNIGIGVNDPQEALHINGSVRSKTVIIEGGADVAERYDIASPVGMETKPGMVVSIDPTNLGKLMISDIAYDRKVAGVISGADGVAPGLILGHDGTVADGETPVANVGRVWCYVDADEGGPVTAGDLLTTATTPGHAMRVDDQARSQGAVLGKAMSSLESGRGLVLVLVSLQ